MQNQAVLSTPEDDVASLVQQVGSRRPAGAACACRCLICISGRRCLLPPASCCPAFMIALGPCILTLNTTCRPPSMRALPGCVVQVADEHGLETGFQLPQASAAQVPAQKVAAPENDLSQRLAELRNK